MSDGTHKEKTGSALVFLAALCLSCSFLISAKLPPWANFYQEVWSSLAISLILIAGLYKSPKQSLRFTGPTLLGTGIILLLIIQKAFGLIFWDGDFILRFAYLGGLLLAIVTAQHLSTTAKGTLLHAFAFAFLIAAIASECLQWFQLSGFRLSWVRDELNILRPSANLSQPNHLGTVFLLGLVSTHYLYKKYAITKSLFYLLTALISVGLAVTGSRTAAIGTILVAAFYWYATTRNNNPGNATNEIPFHLLLPSMMIGSHIIVWLMWTYFPFGAMLNIASKPELFRHGTSYRFEAWLMFANRIMDAPWFGYGIGQTSLAHLFGDSRPVFVGALFTSAHNIALDIVLWTGVPIGSAILISGSFVILRVLRTSTQEQLFSSVAILTLLNHANFELPFFYSYFLLPFGIFIGLNYPTTHQVSANSYASNKFLLVPIVAATVLVGKISWDHYKTAVLMRSFDIHRQSSRLPFDIKDNTLGVNTHYLMLIKFSTTDLHLHIPSSKIDIQEMQRTAIRLPTPQVIMNYAIQLEFREQSSDAELWLRRACAISDPSECAKLRDYWIKLPDLIPGKRNTPWPSDL